MRTMRPVLMSLMMFAITGCGPLGQQPGAPGATGAPLGTPLAGTPQGAPAPAGPVTAGTNPLGPVTAGLPLPPSGTPGTGAGNGRVICIDPGHPSETAEGASANGAVEVTVCWQVALKLKAQLEGSGFTVVMTKSAERERVTNQRRAEIANQAGAALAIRLHAEDVPNQNGFRLYYPDRQGTHAATGKTGPSQEVISASGRAAEAVFAGMRSVLTLQPLPIRGDSATEVGSRQGALTGSIHSTVPVVLCEMVVLRDPNDARFITSEEGQTQMARALATGIAQAVGAGQPL
jgi:N-acetylmuramoyl-L-alanine amidase